MTSNYTDEELVKILKVAASHWNAKDHEKAVYEQCALRIEQLAKEVEGLKDTAAMNQGQIQFLREQLTKNSNKVIALNNQLFAVTADRDGLWEKLKAKV